MPFTPLRLILLTAAIYSLTALALYLITLSE